MAKEIKGKYGGKLLVWEKGESGNPKGRPKKLVPTMKVEGYKLFEINDTIQSIISMNIEQLKNVWNDPNATILEKTVAGALRKSLEKGNLESVETLLNRVYGKPKEHIDMETKGETSIKIEIIKNNNNILNG
jgi:hypothetical protein